MTEYPNADRYIPATAALLEGWVGPGLRQTDQGDWTPCAILGPSRSPDYVVVSHFGYQPAARIDRLRLDPRRPEVRDHLIRHLSLPAWMRDGAGLEPWQSAGLIACAAAGGIVVDIYIPWQASVTGGCRRVRYPLLHTGQPIVDHDGESATDTAALAHGCALMIDADTMLLPWPGGPRVWRRT